MVRRHGVQAHGRAGRDTAVGHVILRVLHVEVDGVCLGVEAHKTVDERDVHVLAIGHVHPVGHHVQPTGTTRRCCKDRAQASIDAFRCDASMQYTVPFTVRLPPICMWRMSTANVELDVIWSPPPNTTPGDASTDPGSLSLLNVIFVSGKAVDPLCKIVTLQSQSPKDLEWVPAFVSLMVISVPLAVTRKL